MMPKVCLDVLLVSPGTSVAVYQKLGDNLSAIEPPLLAGLFAEYLRRKGLSVAIVDAPAHNLIPEQVARHVQNDFSPSLVVMVVYGAARAMRSRAWSSPRS